MNVAKLLKLDSNVIQAHAEAYYGYALADRKPGLASGVKADFLTIAASYWAAVDPKRSVKCFTEAAAYAIASVRARETAQTDLDIHQQEWLARAATLSVCGAGQMDDQIISAGMGDFGDGANSLSPACAGALLLLRLNAGLHHRDARDRFNLAREAMGWVARFEGHRTGKLGFPIFLYLRLAHGVMESRNSQGEEILRTWAEEFGTRLAEPIHLAQTTSYHWENLHSSLLPIDPEALGITLVYLRAVQQAGVGKIQVEHPPELRAYVEVAGEILGGQEPERERRVRLR